MKDQVRRQLRRNPIAVVMASMTRPKVFTDKKKEKNRRYCRINQDTRVSS